MLSLIFKLNVNQTVSSAHITIVFSNNSDFLSRIIDHCHC